MNRAPRRKFNGTERVTVTALTATALTGVATVLIASGLTSCETVEAKPQKSPSTPATTYASPDTASSSSQSVGNVSPSASAETSAANTDPWADIRQQLATPFGSCAVRSYTNDGRSSSDSSQVVLRFNDTEFTADRANIDARAGRTNGVDGVGWTDSTLAPIIIDGDGNIVGKFESSTTATSSNGAPTGSEAYLPADGNIPEGATVVMGVYTHSFSPVTDETVATTTVFVPCSGDSQLAFTRGSWRPVPDDEQITELPPAIIAES